MDLSTKQIRLAMIKGRAEKRHPELRPYWCQPLDFWGKTGQYIEYVLAKADKKEYNITDKVLLAMYEGRGY